MRQVLQEVQQRCFAVSIIWLHDGFWICSSVRDDIIREAEQNALKSLFPDSCQEERILRITSLSEEVETAKDILAAVKPSILFPHCGQSKRRAPKFTREFPKAKFSSRQVAKRKATTYFARIAKRLRPDWLMSNFDIWLLLCSLLAQSFDRHFCGTAFNITESGRCCP